MTKEKLDKFNKILNSGDLYNCYDPELLQYQSELVEKINEFNKTPETQAGHKKRDEILRESLGTYGEGLFILPPIYANFGLKHVHVGKNVFINFSAIFVDDGDIYIGDNVMFGPRVTVITAAHPISPKLRKHQLQFNKPVHIEKNVWIGANVSILPGVTIGENSVVGVGAVVTKDVPPNVIVVGNPAHILREITEEDDKFNDKRPIPQEILEKYR